MIVDAVVFSLGGSPAVEVQLASAAGLAPLPVPSEDAVSRFAAAMSESSAAMEEGRPAPEQAPSAAYPMPDLVRRAVLWAEVPRTMEPHLEQLPRQEIAGSASHADAPVLHEKPSAVSAMPVAPDNTLSAFFSSVADVPAEGPRVFEREAVDAPVTVTVRPEGVVVEREAPVASAVRPVSVAAVSVAEAPVGEPHVLEQVVVNAPVTAIVRPEGVAVEREASVAPSIRPVSVAAAPVAEAPVEGPRVFEREVVDAPVTVTVRPEGVVMEREAPVAPSIRPVSVAAAPVAEAPVEGPRVFEREVVDAPVTATVRPEEVVMEREAPVAPSIRPVSVAAAPVAEVPVEELRVLEREVVDAPVTATVRPEGVAVERETPVAPAVRPVSVAAAPVAEVPVEEPRVFEREVVDAPVKATVRPEGVVMEREALVAPAAQIPAAEPHIVTVPVEAAPVGVAHTVAPIAVERPVAETIPLETPIAAPHVVGTSAVQILRPEATSSAAPVAEAVVSSKPTVLVVPGAKPQNEGETVVLQAAPVVEPVAPAAAFVVPEGVQVAFVARSRSEAIVDTVNQIVATVVDRIEVSSAFVRGEGVIRISLRQTVLDGSAITLSAKDGALTVAIEPATVESAQLAASALPHLESALAAHAPAFHRVAVVLSAAKKEKSDETD